MSDPTHWVVAIGALAAALYALHRLALWLEARGWLYYTQASRKTRTSLSFFAAFDPNVRRIQELQEREQSEQDEIGDDPPDDFKLG
jgi:hypothetical protein